MLVCNECKEWSEFLEHVKKKCSAIAFENWFSSIKVLKSSEDNICLEVPNIFVKNYILDNYKQELSLFIPTNSDGEPNIEFIISEPKKISIVSTPTEEKKDLLEEKVKENFDLKLNHSYHFENFIEGPSNQFVKSAAIGIANKPGKSYNPLFIHGGVGLGKTHLLHAIGHYVKDVHKKIKVHCITTEAFINDLVDNLKAKSVDKMKKFYRSLDIFLVDDIQFLQNRLNFEDEFCNTFETLINQNKQIVITSDKPPSQLKLSERIVARMEWGLVAHVGTPDLETRVAILQHKSEQKGLIIPNSVAFLIAEHIYGNVRQLEGAINKLLAHSRLFNKEINEEMAEDTLKELFQVSKKNTVSIENILKTVATVFQVRISDLKGASRTKEIALARQAAMYLAKTMIKDSLVTIASFFGKTHSTILYACKTMEEKIETNPLLKRQISLCQKNLEL